VISKKNLIIKKCIYCLNQAASIKFRSYIIRKRKKNPDLFYKIDKILDEFHTNGGLKWNGQDFKLFHLWMLCCKRKPRSIIELGSGSSTAILCEYIKVANCRLTTIDESEQWLENTKKICADPNKNIKWQFATRGENTSEKIPTCWYNFDAKENFDFAIVNGPSLNHDQKIRSIQVCVDALRLKFPSSKVTIAIDGRISTYRYLVSKLDTTWKAQTTTNVFFASTLLKNRYRNYSLIER
jgi:hypothetical protein